MYNLSATNKLQDGGTHFATLRTITSSSSSNSILRKLDELGSVNGSFFLNALSFRASSPYTLNLNPSNLNPEP